MQNLLFFFCALIFRSGAAIGETTNFNQECDSKTYRAGFVFIGINQVLPDSVGKVITVESALACASQCLRETWCISINYETSRSSNNCELNTKGLMKKQFNRVEAEQILAPSNSYHFSQIRPLKVRILAESIVT